MNVELNPSTIVKITDPYDIDSFTKSVVNAQPDIIQKDDPKTEFPSNYEILYEERIKEPVKKDPKIALANHTHDTANQTLTRYYERNVVNEKENKLDLIEKILEGKHPTCPTTENSVKQIKEIYGIEPENYFQQNLWGKNLGEKVENISNNIIDVRNAVDGDKKTPVTENFSNQSLNEDFELRSIADIKLKDYQEDEEIIEMKLKWSDNPDIPCKGDILQAKMTAKAQNANKAYLVYPGMGEVYDMNPISQSNLEQLIEEVKPVLTEVNKNAGWENTNSRPDDHTKNIIREKLDSTIRKYYRKKTCSETLQIDNPRNILNTGQTKIEAF